MDSSIFNVTSRDGTHIASWISGSGPPLVLVHGTSADHKRWPAVIGEFEKHFTVYAVDRRGRGGSGDTEPYQLDREFEDIAAVTDAIKEPVRLLGHSYGALCCLGASKLTKNLYKMVLYEPPIIVNDHGNLVGVDSDIHVIKEMEALLQAGDREGVVITFLKKIVQMSDQEITAARTAPGWDSRITAAHTIFREERSPSAFQFNPSHFRAVQVPTLMIAGDSGFPGMVEAAQAMAAVFPNGFVKVLHGQGHTAMNTATKLFLRETIDFLND
jgi:pimeloyl-ACP methyl ester carboxylesterase